MSLQTLILVLACISFFLGAAGVPSRINWDQLGKALVVAAVLVGGVVI